MNETITKRDLIEQNVDKVIDKNKAAGVAVSADFGGTGFTNMLEVIESAKMMSMAGPMIPQWLRGNLGGCWGVILQAIEWKFSPLSVARMSFEVNGNIAYMSQLVHAVIEARAPLQKRMRCEYEGKNGDRVCVVTGLFEGEDEPQVYRSPKIKDIKPKNSPLWLNDPDQQLWYFSSRAWCRRFAPDILLGVYSKDELLDNPAIAEASDGARDVSPGLHARLAGSPRSDEGHKAGHVDSELDQIATGGEIIESAAETSAEPEPKGAAAKEAKRKKADAPATPTAEPETPPVEPKPEQTPTTVKDYVTYATAWINATAETVPMGQRWATERKLRNDLGMTADDRKLLEALMDKRRDDLDGAAS